MTAMDATDGELGAMIVRNIDVLQAAVEYANIRMYDLLGKQVIDIFDSQIRLIDGDGDEPEELEDIISIASPHWRRPSDSRREHYIWVTLETTDDSEKLWLSEFAGVSGAGILLRVSTVLGKRDLKTLLERHPKITQGFQELGMNVDPGMGFELPIEFDRERLALGFAEEDLRDALEPLAIGLRRIMEATTLTDALLEAVKAVKL